ncbi:MAG: extracellular solute-binding protein [Deltaproteobacteria bacterium]|nr:extracellular solute-binding protein [Deltaproteobacteria bacterium]
MVISKFLRALAFTLTIGIFVFLFSIPSNLRAQSVEEVIKSLKGLSPKERQEKLVEGAKREGKVVFYAATRASQAKLLLDSLMKRYPFIKAVSYRAAGFRLVTKILTEARAKLYEPDIIEVSGPTGYELIRAGLVARYRSPESKYLRKEFVDKDGLWTGLMGIRVAVGYNTTLVKKGEAPKSYHDLLDPKWKGKVSIDNQDSEVLLGFMDAWGEEKAFAFFKGLAKNQVTIRRSRTLQSQLVVAGEYHMAAFLHGSTPAKMKRQGAPIEAVMFDPFISKVGATYLAKFSRHPHAAILLYDYLLSEEIQTNIAVKFGRGSVRLGIKGKYPELERERYQVVNPSVSGPRFRKINKIFNKTFGITG